LRLLDDVGAIRRHDRGCDCGAAKRKAPPEPTPELRATWNEVSGLKRKSNEIVVDIREAQKKYREDWRHQILRSLNPRMLEKPPPSASSLGDSIKLYPTVYKAGSRNLCSSTARRKYWHLISNAEAFDNLEPGQQAEHLCHALFEDFGVLKTLRLRAPLPRCKLKSPHSSVR